MIKQILRKWLEIPEEKEDEPNIELIVGQCIEDLFKCDPTRKGYWIDNSPRFIQSKIESIIREQVDFVSRQEISSKTSELARAYIEGEEFIDNIVHRIKIKQL